jgi:hypothetical protein
MNSLVPSNGSTRKKRAGKLRLFSATRLLRHDGNIRRELLERFEQDRLGVVVGACHRAQIVLEA